MLINFLQVTLNQPTQVEDSLNAFDLAVKGGWVMIPLTLLLVIAVYIFFERFMVLRNASRIDTNFMNRIKDYIHDGKIEAASTFANRPTTPLPG